MFGKNLLCLSVSNTSVLCTKLKNDETSNLWHLKGFICLFLHFVVFALGLVIYLTISISWANMLNMQEGNRPSEPAITDSLGNNTTQHHSWRQQVLYNLDYNSVCKACFFFPIDPQWTEYHTQSWHLRPIVKVGWFFLKLNAVVGNFPVKVIFIQQAWGTGQECLFFKTVFICLDEDDIWSHSGKTVANFIL